MIHRALQYLIGRAIVDKSFREQLLDGSRQQLLAEFDLTDDERLAIESIEASTLEEFACRLHRWIEAIDDRV